MTRRHLSRPLSGLPRDRFNRHLNPRLSRRGLLGLAALLPAAGAAGCSWGGQDVLPPGWDRVLADDVSLPVPSSWRHSPTSEELAVFTDLWVEEGGAGHVAAVGAPDRRGAEEALTRARLALSTALPGFQPSTQPATAERHDMMITYTDFTTTPPDPVTGRLWVLEDAASTAVVVLMASVLDHSVRDGIDAGVALTSLAGAPELPADWARVGRGAVTLGIPRSWVVTGPPPRSTRWRAGWAGAAPDGAAAVRLLLAPETDEPDVVDAIAQIEADAVAGSLPGYARRAEPVPVGREGGFTGTRVDFTYTLQTGPSQGCLWALKRGDTVSAVQVAFDGAADESVVAQLEESLWPRETS